MQINTLNVKTIFTECKQNQTNHIATLINIKKRKPYFKLNQNTFSFFDPVTWYTITHWVIKPKQRAVHINCSKYHRINKKNTKNKPQNITIMYNHFTSNFQSENKNEHCIFWEYIAFLIIPLFT